MNDSQPTQDMTREWNYHPRLPLQNPSIFQWPPRPAFLIGWLHRNWLSFSEKILILLLAVLLWYFLYPPLEATQHFAVGWIMQIYLINLLLHCLVAGSLHWYFQIRVAQGKKLKFDYRDMGRGNRLWSFSDQVLDNIFWSLASGVTQLTAYQVLTLWLMSNAVIPTLSFSANPIWFLLLFILIPMWSAFHFYWVHRWLHSRLLYKRVHSLHHRNVNIGPWSGLSMHPVEHLIYLSSLCIHWIVASHPLHLYFHVIFQGPGAAMSHAGYEDLLIKDKRRLSLGTFYHQLHHRYFKCNYGNQELPLDRWFGTFHDGSAEATARVRARL